MAFVSQLFYRLCKYVNFSPVTAQNYNFIMLPAAHIFVGISTPNCLAFSPDGELAIAAGEEVYLLVPRRDADVPWTHTHFLVNTFTPDEWPVQTQVGFAEMSIGEEQARVTVTSLAWSAPGLAKYRRSVLAVLTSNLMLSLWAPDSNPIDPKGWRRVLIIGNTRVRCMAWVPANPSHAEDQSPISTRKWGIFILTTADDENGLYFWRISSPSMSQHTSWDAQLLAHEGVQRAPQSNARPSLLRTAMNAKQFIDYIDYNDWESDDHIMVKFHSSGVSYQSRLTVAIESELQITLSDTKSSHSKYKKSISPPWAPSVHMQHLIQNHKQQYSVEHHLILDNFVLKTWGFARFSNLVALCITSHPGKVVEYEKIIESSATILFENCEDSGAADKAFAWQEPLLLGDDMGRQKVLSTILDNTILLSLQLTAFDLKIIYAAVYTALFYIDRDSQQAPHLNAADLALSLLETKSSACLRVEHEYIENIRCSSHAGSGNSDQASMYSVDQTNATDKSFLDVCPFCEDGRVGSGSAAENFMEARCPKGHPFSRSFMTDIEKFTLLTKLKPDVRLLSSQSLSQGAQSTARNVNANTLTKRSLIST